MSFLSIAQRVPDWVTNTPTPTNDTYLYVVESAFGTSEISARNQAIATVYQSAAMRLGQPVNSEEINRAVQSGTSFDVISRNYNIPINKVCEYTENKSGNFRVYILCQIAKSGNIPVQFDAFNACFEGANKFFAEEALSPVGFEVYRNSQLISEHEIRTLFANSRSYDYYEKGMSICNSAFWNNKEGGGWTGVSYLAAGCFGVGVIPLIMVGGLALSGELGEMDEEDLPVYRSASAIGWTLVAAGGALLILKPRVLSYGKSQIRKAVYLYNNGKMYAQNAIELKYGFTGSGLCVTLNF